MEVPGLKIVFICQAVDLDDMLLANVVRWIDVLARKPRVERIHVICLRAGPYELPANVSVAVIGARHKLRTLSNFYREVLGCLRQHRADFFFVHMGGVYPILLSPIKLITRRPIYQWKTHPHIDWVMKLSFLVDDRVFTATPASFPRRSRKVRVTGHGINIEKFTRNRPLSPSKTLVTVSRLSSVKRIHEMATALAVYRDRYGPPPALEVVGEPATAMDRRYVAEVRRTVERLGLEDTVHLLGRRSQDEVADLVSRSLGFLGFSATALDKATVEAMALRVPVVSTNPCFGEILPPALRARFTARPGDSDDQAARIHDVVSMDDAERARVGDTLRDIVVKSHTDEALFDTILEEIQT